MKQNKNNINTKRKKILIKYENGKIGTHRQYDIQ